MCVDIIMLISQARITVLYTCVSLLHDICCNYVHFDN